MKYSLGISSFLEEISSLSHSVVFLYFFALITEEGFLLAILWNKLDGGFQKALDSTTAHMVEQAAQNGCCQRLCPLGDLQLPPPSVGSSPRSAGGSDPGSLHITASSLGARICEILHTPFQSGSLFPTAFLLSQ